MADLNRLVSDNLALAVGALGLLVLLLVAWVAALSLRLGRATRAYRSLVRDTDGGSLRDVLATHLERVDAVGRRLEEVDELQRYLEQRTRGALQHIGLVRFNPFEDTGGDQSFAIAVLDDRRDGIVLSSLHGRAYTRVFAKPVENGASRHNLSDEESQAIRIAVEGTAPIPGGG
ncbi:MAG TPA: DUF4446 family protein [Candidatus Limnocylindria bacterium]|nr:DUF4446 family protein [Candidatus Limnocylindria bacterium]